MKEPGEKTEKKIKKSGINNDIININKALERRLVNYFSTRNNKKFRQIRKGTSHIILNNQPLVIPIVINGFNDKFEENL